MMGIIGYNLKFIENNRQNCEHNWDEPNCMSNMF